VNSDDGKTAALVAHIKHGLRKLDPIDVADYVVDGGGSTETGQWGHVEVDWDVLDREIDKLCAEFAARREQK
jgi:hypothetical protein